MNGYRYFVVLAGMRTGSNFLEANLNQFGDLTCLGELFNPTFVGHHNKSEAFGFDIEQRERRPIELIEAVISQTDALPGFRLFHDHDKRAIAHVLADESCAKIVLSRNDIDSYVSLKIASKTQQWKLSDISKRKSAIIEFDAIEFENFRTERRTFHTMIAKTLKSSGQTWFDLDYAELGDTDILNGVARYLGTEEKLKSTSTALKRQNPGELSEKVSNHAELSSYLAKNQIANNDTARAEQDRGARVRSYIAGRTAPILFMPLPAGPVDPVRRWIAELDGDPLTNLSQTELWNWRKTMVPHRSFTVVRHPLERAHSAYCDTVLNCTGPEQFERRKIIRNRYGVPLPKIDALNDYSMDDHKAAFEGFLKFLKANLADQTSLGTDPSWVPQTTLISGFSSLNSPDLIIRENELPQQLAGLAHTLGIAAKDVTSEPAARKPCSLSDIEDSYLRKRAFDVYRKDYIALGYERPE